MTSESEELYHTQRKFQQCAEDTLRSLKQCPDISAQNFEILEEKLKSAMCDLTKWMDSLPQIVTVQNNLYSRRSRSSAVRHSSRLSKFDHSRKFNIASVPMHEAIFSNLEPYIVPIGGYKPVPNQARRKRQIQDQSHSCSSHSSTRERSSGDCHTSPSTSTPVQMKEISIVLDKLPSYRCNSLARSNSDGLEHNHDSDATTDNDYTMMEDDEFDLTRLSSCGSVMKEVDNLPLSWDLWHKKVLLQDQESVSLPSTPEARDDGNGRISDEDRFIKSRSESPSLLDCRTEDVILRDSVHPKATGTNFSDVFDNRSMEANTKNVILQPVSSYSKSPGVFKDDPIVISSSSGGRSVSMSPIDAPLTPCDAQSVPSSTTEGDVASLRSNSNSPSPMLNDKPSPLVHSDSRSGTPVCCEDDQPDPVCQVGEQPPFPRSKDSTLSPVHPKGDVFVSIGTEEGLSTPVSTKGGLLPSPSVEEGSSTPMSTEEGRPPPVSTEEEQPSVVSMEEGPSTEEGPPIHKHLSDRPPSPICAEEGPPTPVRAEEGPSTPVRVEEGPSTPVRAEEGPSTPVRAEERPSTPVRAEEGPSTPVRAEEGPSTPVHANEGPPTPVHAEEGPPTPVRAEEGPPTPVRAEEIPLTPVHAKEGPPTPLHAKEGPPTPVRAEEGPPTPVRTDEVPSTPVRADEGPPTPVRADEGPPTPVRADEGPPTPVRAEEGPSTPVCAAKVSLKSESQERSSAAPLSWDHSVYCSITDPSIDLDQLSSPRCDNEMRCIGSPGELTEEGDLLSPKCNVSPLIDSSEFFTADSEEFVSDVASPVKNLRDCAVSSSLSPSNFCDSITTLDLTHNSQSNQGSTTHDQDFTLFSYKFDSTTESVNLSPSDLSSVAEDSNMMKDDTSEEVTEYKPSRDLPMEKNGLSVKDTSTEDVGNQGERGDEGDLTSCASSPVEDQSHANSKLEGFGSPCNPTSSPSLSTRFDRSQGSLQRKSLKLLRKRRLNSSISSLSSPRSDLDEEIARISSSEASGKCRRLFMFDSDMSLEIPEMDRDLDALNGRKVSKGSIDLDQPNLRGEWEDSRWRLEQETSLPKMEGKRDVPGERGVPEIPQEKDKSEIRNEQLEPMIQGDPDDIVIPGDPDEPMIPGDPDEPMIPGDPDEPMIPGDPDEPMIQGDPDEPTILGEPNQPDEAYVPDKLDEIPTTGDPDETSVLSASKDTCDVSAGNEQPPITSPYLTDGPPGIGVKEEFSSFSDHTYSLTIPTRHTTNGGHGTPQSTKQDVKPVPQCVSCNKLMRERGKRKYTGYKKHQVLDVLQCRKCFNFYNSDSFTYDNGKQNECLICGEGGEVIECERSCPYSVCVSCVKRIEGSERCAYILGSDEPYVCCACDPTPIVPYIHQYKTSRLCSGSGGQPTKSAPSKTQRLSHPEKSPPPKKLKAITSATGNVSAEEQTDSKVGFDDDSSLSSSSDVEDDEDLIKIEDIFRKKQVNSDTPHVPLDEKNSCDVSDEKTDCVSSGKDNIKTAHGSDNVVPLKKGAGIKRQRFTNRHQWFSDSDKEEDGTSSTKGDDLLGEDDTLNDRDGKLSEDSDVMASDCGGDGDNGGNGDNSGDGDNNSGSGGDGGENEGPDKREDDVDERVKTAHVSKKRRLNLLFSDSSDEECLSRHVEVVHKPEESLQMSDSVGKGDKFVTEKFVSRQINPNSSEDSCDEEEEIGSSRVPKGKKIGEDNQEKELKKEEMDDILSSARVTKDKQSKRRKEKSAIKRGKYIIFESDSDQTEDEGEIDDDDIIVLSDTDESDGDEEISDTATTPVKKDTTMRRNIRKIMSSDKLALETRQAQKEEQERHKRLKDRVHYDLKDRIIFEGTESKPVIEMRRELVAKLKPHQREGVKFLWNNICEDLKTLQETPGSGAILAHCMGLGKTLQLIAFIDTLLNEEETGIRHVLIIVPKNTLSNWIDEFKHWTGDDTEYSVVNFNTPVGKNYQTDLISSWHSRGGVGIISYTTYRNLTSEKGKMSRRRREILAKCLRDPGPDIVVCDEGHLLKNCKSALSLTVNQIRTRRRIALTGTPLQNNLQEYYTMVNFVKPNLLGTLKEFNNRFGNPIKNGQCRDATAADVRTMKRRAHVLNYLLSNCVQRKDYRVLTECLPGKHEYVVKLRLSEVQERLYTTVLDENRSSGVMGVFRTFQIFMRIWNHPWMLKLHKQRIEDDLSDSDSDLGGFICDDSDVEEELAAIESKRKMKKRKKKGKSSRPASRSSTSSTPSSVSVEHSTAPITVITLDDENTPKCLPNGPDLLEANSDQPASPQEWYDGILTSDMEYSVELSAKLMFLKELLQETKNLGEKVLLFSQSLLTLDIIEHFLKTEEFGGLTPELDYYRLDGSTASQDRETMTKHFNRIGNIRLKLFLISTRAGSLGINLVSANRVVIFDACWNPSHDLQAIFRVYRFGQTKPVFIYRLIAKGTMEEKIYDRQVTKESTALRVIDDKQIDRHFSNADLQDILKYTRPDLSEANTKERPQADPVFCTILDHLQPTYLLMYHNHDSLLVHQQDEELSEDEKGNAWEEYQNILEGKMYYMAANTSVQPTLLPPVAEGNQQLMPHISSTGQSSSHFQYQPHANSGLSRSQPTTFVSHNSLSTPLPMSFVNDWIKIVNHLRQYLVDVDQLLEEVKAAHMDKHRVLQLQGEIKKKMDQKYYNLIAIKQYIDQIVANPSVQGHPLLSELNFAYSSAYRSWSDYKAKYAP